MFSLQRICLSALLLMLTACAKPISPEKATYIGQWQAPNMSLLITQAGRVIYQRTDIKESQGVKTNISKSLDSPIEAFHGDNFDAGIAPFTTTFVVSKAPHQRDGKWKMIVDGVELTKAE